MSVKEPVVELLVEVCRQHESGLLTDAEFVEYVKMVLSEVVK